MFFIFSSMTSHQIQIYIVYARDFNMAKYIYHLLFVCFLVQELFLFLNCLARDHRGFEKTYPTCKEVY